MITTFFLTIATGVLNLIISIFPTSEGLPVEVTNAVTQFGGYVGILGAILPIGTLATVLGLIIAVELGIFGFKGFKWIFSHVPFVGGKG